MRFGTVGFILATATVLGGCSGSSNPATQTGGTTNTSTPKGDVHTGPVTKLKITDVKVGTGAKAAAGDDLSVSYVGTLANGTMFDSTDKEGGKPMDVTVGAGQVIKGWDQGLVGMQEGGERKLEIPADLAYGNQNKPPIPPGSALFFDIKCVSLTTAAQRQSADRVEKVEIIDEGTGKPVAKGSALTVDYQCYQQAGNIYHTTMDPEKPESFILGGGKVIPGIEKGLLSAASAGIKQGAHIKLTMPPSMGPHGPGVTPQVWTFDIYIRKVQ